MTQTPPTLATPPTLVRDVARGVTVESSRPLVLTNRFTEAMAFDLKGRWRGGIIFAQGSVEIGPSLAAFPSQHHFAAIDVRVVAFVGSAPLTLCRAVLGNDTAPLVLKLEDIEQYTRLVVYARRRIDGGDNTWNEVLYSPGQGPTFYFAAQARFVRT
jgi:hypothetical protein